MTQGALNGPPTQTAAAQPECEEKPMAAGSSRSGTTLAQRLPALCSPADVGRAKAFPHGPMDALDHELEGYVIAAGHIDLARLRSEEHTSELQSRSDLVCRLLLEKKKNTNIC